MATESMTQGAKVNPHLVANREKKKASLISVIDRRLRAAGMDPLSPAVVEELPRMTAQWWRRAAQEAAIHPPSETTIAEVIAFYRARAVPLPAQAGA